MQSAYLWDMWGDGMAGWSVFGSVAEVFGFLGSSCDSVTEHIINLYTSCTFGPARPIE